MIYDTLEKNYLKHFVKTHELIHWIELEMAYRNSCIWYVNNQASISLLKMINEKGLKKSYESVKFELQLNAHMRIIHEHDSIS